MVGFWGKVIMKPDYLHKLLTYNETSSTIRVLYTRIIWQSIYFIFRSSNPFVILENRGDGD